MTSIDLIVYTLIDREVQRAREIHPAWPADVIHATAIVAEEAGESVRAALNHVYHGDEVAHIVTELTQTAATCVRALQSLQEYSVKDIL